VSRALPRTPTRTSTAPLAFETVIGTAQELIAERGFEALTMRALAARCGVTAMSLYRHVRTKEELLVVLADRLLVDMDVPDLEGLSWPDQVAAVFRALHRMWRAHPEFGQIAAAQPVDGKVAYRWMELVLAALERAGLTDEEVVNAYDALASYTAGFLQQHAGRKVSVVPVAERLARMRKSDEFPHVQRLAEPLVERDTERHFDAGLRLILNGIMTQTAEQLENGAKDG
jgi:AcrR family transcriptional regulator